MACSLSSLFLLLLSFRLFDLKVSAHCSMITIVTQTSPSTVKPIYSNPTTALCKPASINCHEAILHLFYMQIQCTVSPASVLQ